MIRDAVIHLLNEQPVVADLLAAPEPADLNLICTNLRTLDGRRPIFVDDSASTFVFPYRHVRFLEIRADRTAAKDADGSAAAGGGAGPSAAPETELEIDEEFLRKIREV